MVLAIHGLLTTSILFHMSVQAVSICPEPQAMYVNRGPYLMCRKKYNCIPGHEILDCDENCAEERCVKCTDGKVQPNLIHSETPEASRKCFVPKIPNCSQRETGTMETRNGTKYVTCPIGEGCVCNLDKCFYGNYPCNCDKRYEACGVNLTLNNDGDCVPCAKGYYKPLPGCQSCFKEDPHKEVPVPTTPSPPTTTSTTTTQAPIVPKPKPPISKPNVTSKTPTTSQSTPRPPIVTEPSVPESQSERPHESGAKMAIMITVIAVIAVIILLVAVAITIFCLYRNGQFGRLKRRLQRNRERDLPHVVPEEDQHPLVNRGNGAAGNRLPHQIRYNGDIVHDVCNDRRPIQAEDPASPSAEDCSPLIPPSSPGVNLEEPSLYQVKKQMEEMGKGKVSLDSQTSVTSSGSIPTPVPETSPAQGAHPLEDVKEYYRSISRDINPEHFDIRPIIESQGLDDIAINVPSATNQEACNNRDAINVSSSTSAVPASSSTATSYPSAIVSNSIQPIGPNDHRVSAIDNSDTNLETPKLQEQSFVTRSLSSDCADNTHDMNTLEPQQHEEESVTERSMVDRVEKGSPDRQLKPSLSDYDSMSELKETEKGGSNS